MEATRLWKSITIHEIDAICSGLSSTWISVLSGARVAVAVEHGITGESSLKNWKKFSQDQATLKKFDYSKMVSDIDQLFSSHENLVYEGSLSIGFMWKSFLVLAWEHFEYLLSKIRFSPAARFVPFLTFFDFSEKWPTLRDSGDQTTWPTWTYRVSYER